MSECQCAAPDCRRWREAVAFERARKAEQTAPEYDWEELEKQSTRARQDPDWYKRSSRRAK